MHLGHSIRSAGVARRPQGLGEGETDCREGFGDAQWFGRQAALYCSQNGCPGVWTYLVPEGPLETSPRFQPCVASTANRSSPEGTTEVHPQIRHGVIQPSLRDLVV